MKGKYWCDDMKNIPPDILTRFDDILKLRNVPLFSRPEYRKWVRYFLDFQTKYPLPGERALQVRLFSEKLRSKGQVEAQVEQAADAVSLFFASQQKQLQAAPLSNSTGADPHEAVRGSVQNKTIGQTAANRQQ